MTGTGGGGGNGGTGWNGGKGDTGSGGGAGDGGKAPGTTGGKGGTGGNGSGTGSGGTGGDGGTGGGGGNGGTGWNGGKGDTGSGGGAGDGGKAPLLSHHENLLKQVAAEVKAIQLDTVVERVATLGQELKEANGEIAKLKAKIMKAEVADVLLSHHENLLKQVAAEVKAIQLDTVVERVATLGQLQRGVKLQS